MVKPKSSAPRQKAEDAPRSGRPRAAGELVGKIGGMAFKRFGFVQSAIVSRWSEIVGERYAKVFRAAATSPPRRERALSGRSTPVENA